MFRSRYMAVILAFVAIMAAVPAYSFSYHMPESSNRKTPPGVPQEARNIYNRGMQAFHNSDYQAAVTLFTQAGRMCPAWEWPHQMLSTIYSGLKRNEDAVREARLASYQDPDDEGAWVDLVAAYLHTMRMTSAIQTGQGYLKRFPRGKFNTDIVHQISLAQNEIERRKKVGALEYNPADYLPFAIENGRSTWNHFPLTVFIANSSGCKNYDRSFNQMLPDAFAEWQRGLGGLVSFKMVDDPANCDIECSWTDDPQVFTAAGEGGECFTTRDTSVGNILHARIKILTPSKEHEVTTADLKQVCLHEIGHALGLQGHSDDGRDVMDSFSSNNLQLTGLTRRDINTVCKLYGRDPQTTALVVEPPKLYANAKYSSAAPSVESGYYTSSLQRGTLGSTGRSY